jgi:hypothetical protein
MLVNGMNRALLFVVLLALVPGPAWSHEPGKDITAPYGAAPQIDGIISAGEWAAADSVVYDSPEGQCTVLVLQDGSALFVAIEVPDSTYADGDRTMLYIDPLHDAAAAPQPDDRMFIQERGGSTIRQIGTGSWWAWQSGGAWSSATTSDAAGWRAEFRIDYSEIGISPGQPGLIMGIDFSSKDGLGYYRWTTDDGTNWRNPSRWGNISSPDDWGPPAGPTATATPAPATPTASPTPPPPATPSPSPRPTPMPGDVDGDGSVTTSDALLAFQIALGLHTPTPEEEAAADVDGNPGVSTSDALCIFQEALGLPNPCFP